MTNPQLLARFIAIDAALASRDGLHLGEMAGRLGISIKSVRRDLASLAALNPVVCRQVSAANRSRHSHRHWYSNRRRVFAAWLDRETRR